MEIKAFRRLPHPGPREAGPDGPAVHRLGARSRLPFDRLMVRLSLTTLSRSTLLTTPVPSLSRGGAEWAALNPSTALGINFFEGRLGRNEPTAPRCAVTSLPMGDH